MIYRRVLLFVIYIIYALELGESQNEQFLFSFNQATEMLLFNKKLTAAEACSLGLVTEVFPDSTFQKEVWARLKAYVNLPKKVSQKATDQYFISLYVYATL